jgi:CheY-like chemotaxis protein/HPt (histidine-containing phosphotransfer) domain-containing protein
MVSLDQPAPAPTDTARAVASVLLVDDQRFVGLALGRLLDAESGFALHCCERGADAVAEAVQLQPSVILQDLVMPDVDGLALVQRYREHPATARIPVVVLSGNDDAATRARALAAGAAAYLVKLPSRDLLLEALRQQVQPGAIAAIAYTSPPSGPAGEAVLDPETLASYRDDGAPDPNETLRALIEVFLTDADDLMAALRAVPSGDAAGMKPIAHALKGCSLAIGAHRLAAMCARLETGGVSATLTLEQLDTELTRVRTACAEVRSSAPVR